MSDYYRFTIGKRDNNTVSAYCKKHKIEYTADSRKELLNVIRNDLGNYRCYKRINKWLFNTNINFDLGNKNIKNDDNNDDNENVE